MAVKNTITDTEMRSKPGERDTWFVEPAGDVNGARSRGGGALVGRITPSGARAFYFRYTDHEGKQVRLKLGDYPATPLAQAREKAHALSRLYKGDGSGAIPVRDLRGHFAQLEADRLKAEESQALQAAQEAERQELERQRRLTVRQVFKRWADVDLAPQLRADGTRSGRKDGGEYTRQQFERYVFPSLGDVAALDVTKADLMTVLDGIKAAGKLRTANVVFSDLKQMLAFAVDRDVIQRNPLDTVKKARVGGKETERDRVLDAAEIKELVSRIPDARLNKRTALGIWILLGTGARIGELMGSVLSTPGWTLESLAALPEAQDVMVGVVNLEAKTWHLPTTKNEREHTIHLSDFVVDHFKQLAQMRVADDEGKVVPWLFPNTSANGPVCVKSFGKQLADRQRPADRRMSGRSKHTESLTLPGGRWTSHDLRRTAGTLMASLGISGDVIDECLNHVIESRVRRTYIRDRRPAEQARAFDALGAKLEQITSGVTLPSNVVEMRAA